MAEKSLAEKILADIQKEVKKVESKE